MWGGGWGGGYYGQLGNGGSENVSTPITVPGVNNAVSIVAGVLVLVVTASTALPTGLIKSIPVQAHAVIDFLLAAVLIASPFLFGFSDDGTATPFFIVLGVLHLLLTIATRFVSEERPRRQRQAT